MELVRDGLTAYLDLGILFVHLVSGEDIIGECEEGGGVLKIRDAMMPQVHTQDGKNFRIGLLPFRPFLFNEALTIPNKHVMLTAKLDSGLENTYRKMTGRIVIEEPQIVTP